jgi:hypothetical protein
MYVLLGWDNTIGLTSTESHTRVFLFLALVAILYSEAECDGNNAQLRLILITPVKFRQSPTSSLTCESRPNLKSNNKRTYGT